jgi:hypothetical protein
MAVVLREDVMYGSVNPVTLGLFVLWNGVDAQ